MHHKVHTMKVHSYLSMYLEHVTMKQITVNTTGQDIETEYST